MIRNILTNFSSRIAVAALNFFMLLLTTHFLGVNVRGTISIIGVGMAMIHIVSDLAGGPSLVYLTPRTRLRTLQLTGSIWAIFSSLTMGITMLHFGELPIEYKNEILIIAIFISLHSLNQNLLLGQLRIKAFNILFFTQGMIQFTILLVCIFIFHQRDIRPYLYSNIVGYGICYFFGLILVSKNAPIPKISESRMILFVLFANGFFTQAASFCLQYSKSITFENLKKIISVKDNSSVGLYNTAFSLGETILLFSASVSAIVLAKVSNEKNHADIRSTVFQLCKLSLGMTAIGILIFLAMPSGFYSWLLGKDFSPVKNIFITIAPGIFFISAGSVFANYFLGAGKHYLNFIGGSCALLIVIFTSAPLIRIFGIEGAGYCNSLAYGTLTLVVFFVFILIGGNKKRDWLKLIPSKQDFVFLKNRLKK